jgi:hypothetical protein
VEKRALEVAIEWCEEQGWTHIVEVGNRQSWDLEAQVPGGSGHRYIEVKGTTGDRVDVVVTKGEVDAARRYGQRSVLIVVTGITASATRDGSVVARGGRKHVFDPWAPRESELTEIQYLWKPTNRHADP